MDLWGTDAAYSKSCDAGDTWYTFGLGGTVSLTDNAVFMVTLKIIGGDVTTNGSIMSVCVSYGKICFELIILII